MKKLITLVICLALTGVAMADQHKKKGKNSDETAAAAPEGAKKGKNKGGEANRPYFRPGTKKQLNAELGGGHGSSGAGAGKATFKEFTVKKQTEGKLHKADANLHLKKFEKKQFKLAEKAKADIPNVKFQQGMKLKGADHWKGNKYVVFKNYKCEWHDKDWWHHHHNNIVFVFGGWYFWDAGYWFPAWGYAPDAFFAYEGPIYAGTPTMDPGQVVANVQAALQEQGYYTGEVDGVLGPLTRAALAQYQQSQGFEPTGAIDEPTLESLGMV